MIDSHMAMFFLFGLINLVFGISLASAYWSTKETVFVTTDGSEYELEELILALRLACARLMKGAEPHAIDMLSIQMLREAKATLKELPKE